MFLGSVLAPRGAESGKKEKEEEEEETFFFLGGKVKGVSE